MPMDRKRYPADWEAISAKKRKYTDIYIAGTVYVSSSHHHFFSVCMKKHGSNYGEHGRSVYYDYCADSGWFDSKSHPMVTLPKYARDEVERLIAEGIRNKQYKYYEYDRDGNQRFQDLRYHDDQWEARYLESREAKQQRTEDADANG